MMRWLPVYNVGIAAICAGAVAVAASGSGAGERADQWTKRAEAGRQSVLRASARDRESVARYTTLAAEYDGLVARVQQHQARLAAEITATRKLRRKVVIGTTIVSYAPAGAAR